MAKRDESFSVYGDVGVSMKTEEQEKSMAMDISEDGMCEPLGKTGKPDDVKWNCRWFPEPVSTSESEPERDLQLYPSQPPSPSYLREEWTSAPPSPPCFRHLAISESSEDEYMKEQGPIMVIHPNGEHTEVRRYAQHLSNAQIALRELPLYENDRKNIPPDLAPYMRRYFDARQEQQLKGRPSSLDESDFDFSSDEGGISEAHEQATHDGETAPRDGKRSHRHDGQSSRDEKKSRHDRKRDRSS